ncbi:MAG: hypothetical protein ABI947_20955 [Chloroflexota bacterium]
MLTKLAKALIVSGERPKRRNRAKVGMMGLTGSAAGYSPMLIEAASKVLATSTDRKRLAMKHLFNNSAPDLSDLSVGSDEGDLTDAMQRGMRRNRSYQQMQQMHQMAGKGGSTISGYIKPYRGCTKSDTTVYQDRAVQHNVQGSTQNQTAVNLAIGLLGKIYQLYWLVGTHVQQESWPTPIIQN